MDGWKTIVAFWDGLCSGAMLVSGSVIDPIKFLDKNVGKYSSPIRRIWDRVDIKWAMKRTLVTILLGMKYYPVIWGVFHKPWSKDPVIQQPVYIMESKGPRDPFLFFLTLICGIFSRCWTICPLGLVHSSNLRLCQHTELEHTTLATFTNRLWVGILFIVGERGIVWGVF